MKNDIYQEALDFHRQHQGKLEIKAIKNIETAQDLSLVYTPGVAEPCRVIAKDKNESFSLTMRGRSVAVVSDGTAVLGLGNIGPEAAMPVMEGKALLLKQFGGVDGVPLVVDAKNPQEIIKFVKQIQPSFVGINLEDIAAPACFIVEDSLQNIGIPVFHDDQHGTAIVVLAALKNAVKVVGKEYSQLKVVVVGAGAAGLAITRMLSGLDCSFGHCDRDNKAVAVKDVILVDSVGIVNKKRKDLNVYKQAVSSFTNLSQVEGDLERAMIGADVVIGVSRAGVIKPTMVEQMADKAIVMAMANPTPEIMPAEALAAGAMIVASGRSDFDNQINNLLAFPGIFRAVVEARLTKITLAMKLAAVSAIAQLVENPSVTNIVPSVFDKNLSRVVAEAVKKAA